MAPSTPASTAERALSANVQGEEEHELDQRRDSVSFGKPEGPETATMVTVKELHQQTRKKSLVPTLAGDHKGIYWPSLAKMILFFFGGLFCCIAHHIYYNTRHGGHVLSQVDQQWALRAGTTFAFLVSTSLVVSVQNAYTQWLWKTLKNKEMSIAALDAAFEADVSAYAIANREMCMKMPVGSLVAIIALSIPIASLITPTTLSIHQGEYYYNTTANVTSLDMSTVDSSRNISQPNQFAVYVPLNGQNSSEYASEVLTGPKTIISRFSSAAASTGDILPIIPSYPNSSYILHFYGPKVECKDASPLETVIIDDLIDAQIASTEAKEMNQEIDYFAFVPVKNSSSVYPILANRPEEPVNATNQLWMAYSQYGNGSSCQNPSIITRKHTVCSLWEVLYTVNFTFENGIQNLTDVDYQLLEEVEYPVSNASAPSNLTLLAYSAYMWAFTNQIIGYIEIYSEKLSNGSAGANYSQIQAPIQDTALLGSSDLDVFFDQRHIRLSGAPNCTLSDQRARDVGLARNDTLDTLIPELSFNITMSYFSNNLLSPLMETNVTTKSIVNFYYYNWRDLWMSYGLALTFALLANILGGAAFWINGVAHDRSFSAYLSATRDPALHKIFNPERLGKLPLPDSVAKTALKFVEMGAAGGLGLKLLKAPPEYNQVLEDPPEDELLESRMAQTS